MPYICPNINTPEWKALVEKVGSVDAAFNVFINNNYDIPSLEETASIYFDIPSTQDNSPEVVKQKLVDTGAFRWFNGQAVVKNKLSYPAAIAEVGRLNRTTPGLVKLVKSPVGFMAVVTEGQLPLYDLPSGTKTPLLLDGFKSFQQQSEVVDVMSSSILAYLAKQTEKKNRRVQLGIEDFEAKIKSLNEATPKEVYAAILANIKDLGELSKKKLQRLNLIAQPVLFGTSLEKAVDLKEAPEETEGVNEVEAIGDWKDEWTFQYDSKNNALEAVKQFLAFTPKTIYKKDENKFRLVESIIPNQPVFLSYDEVYEQLKAILAGIPNTWEAMEAEMLKYEKAKPFINIILKRIAKYPDSELLKRQFVSSMSSSYSGFKTILVKEDKEGNKYFNIIDTDQSSIERTILANWQGAFKRSKVFKVVEGNPVVDRQFVTEYLKRLNNFGSSETDSNINFQEEQTTGYRNRTIKNASADATIAIAVDFNSAGEKLTKSSVLDQNKKYIPINANSLDITEERVNNIVEELNSIPAKQGEIFEGGIKGISLNIAGNGIYTMKGKYTQQQIDIFTYELLKAVISSPKLKQKVSSIRTGGQTGFDEAGAKAGEKLGIPTIILAPKGWTLRTIEGQDVSNENQFKSRFNKTKQGSNKEELKKLLEDIGVTVSEDTLVAIMEGRFNRLPLEGQFTARQGIFKLIGLRLSGKDDTINDEETEETDVLPNDPTVNNSAIRALSKLEAASTDYYYSNTFKDGEGNTVYSYTFNKFLTKEFNRLMTDEAYVNDLLSITFNKPILGADGNPLLDTWLHLLANEPVFKSVFNISPLDTIRVAGTTDNGTKLTSMSDLDLELTQVALIQNSGQRKRGIGKNSDGARVVKYLLTVPSKTTSYVIQGVGQDVKIFFDAQGNYTIDKATKDVLYSIVATEHNRILSQQARKSANAAYDKGATRFLFYPNLNKKLFDSNGNVLLPTDKIGDKTVEEIIKEEIDTILRQDIADKIATWKELGIASEDGLELVDNEYLKRVIKPLADKPSNQLTAAAADYVINSMIAKFNTHQTFIDDPAVYWKKNDKETWDNIGKRLTNLTAPFKDGMIDKDNSKFLSVKLKDYNTAALNRAQLASRLEKYYEANNIALPYDEIDGTDAAEYVTLKEELRVMYMYGEISTKLYTDLMDRIDKDGDNLVLTKEELQQTVFITKKPVYSSRLISKEDDTVYREYIKTASTVLLPQFTKGLEIDKLRRSMEKLEKDKGLTVRAVFDSGTKLGGQGSINIWNEDGSIKDNLDLTNYAIPLDRSNFGIQQEVPYDEKKDETVRSTQVLKFLFDSLDEIEGFRYEGKLHTGEVLKEIYTELNKKVYQQGLAKVESRFVQDGRLVIPKIVDVLRDEAIKRGYSPAQLSFLQSNLENTDFSIPFWAHVSNDKEQAMLTSLWTNKVLKQKMPGGSYVLVSEEGMQGISKSVTYIPTEKVEILDKTTEELLAEEVKLTTKVNIPATDPTDGTTSIEEQNADEAISEIKKQYARLDELIKCLTK